ncbi:DUF354 domain-containing protein [Paludibacter sp.]
MNILIDIAHPAHVHLLRNAYAEFVENGHTVIVTVKDIPSAIELLNKYDIPYVFLGNKHDSMLGKLVMQLVYNIKLLWIVLTQKIKIGFGSSLTLAQISKISGMKSVILDDDDDDVEPLFVKYAHPYADVVFSPEGTQRATKAFIPYKGYHELAYLHPNRFTPDINVLKTIGLTENDVYFVLRFNAFKAHHDVGVQGLSIEDKRKLIKYLEQKGRVFITTERNIDDEFKKYQLLLPSEKIHSLLYYATMFIGDSQTMTSEAAVLGTPAVKCNSFAGRLSVPNELEDKYGLCYSFLPDDSESFSKKIEELLNMENLQQSFQQRRQKMLSEKIDVTAFFIWFIENYPESSKIMKENPDYQYKFK